MRASYIYDLATGAAWSSVDDGFHLPATLAFGFCADGALPVNLSGITFTVRAMTSRGQVVEQEFPTAGVAYRETDQTHVETVDLPIKHGDAADIEFTVYRDRNIISSASYGLTVPIPPSPYASWVWDATDAVWKAPVSRPDIEQMYWWDEANGEWSHTEIPLYETTDANDPDWNPSV